MFPTSSRRKPVTPSNGATGEVVAEFGFGVLDGGLIAFDLGDKLRNRGLLVGDLPRGADEVLFFRKRKTTSLTRASP
jgi:hypothetical protein